MITISTVLALFTLLIVASVVFFVAKRIKVPYTVLLVVVGLILVPLVKIPFFNPVFGYLDDLSLTPELLFYVFLPVLIFESAFNMNIRRMVESAWSISLLAVVGLMISAFIIATVLYFVLPLVGLTIPFIVALLFGAIISSTDPVAVLALFKEYGAPKRLTLMFEGESLFNDGTAVALFFVVLAIAESGFNGAETIVSGIGLFLMMVSAGILLGVIMAIIFSRALRYTKSNEFVSITLLIISAHVVFILGELINEYGIFGVPIHVSSIIATTISALFLGNYSRHILSPKSDSYIEKSVEHLAFVANSLVFLLAGILFASTEIDFGLLLEPILVTILVVAGARAVSVYAVIKPLNRFKLEAPVSDSWQALLAWGSLRGALAIIVILLIPEDFTVAGWQYGFTVQNLLLALAIGCILATLFIKALTIAPLMSKLNINQHTLLENVYHAQFGLYYLYTEKARFDEQKTKGFVSDVHYTVLRASLDEKIAKARSDYHILVQERGVKVFEQSLRLAAIRIERRYLKELYVHDEVSEVVYRRLQGKLTLQQEKIEYAQYDDINPSMYTDRKDIFDNLVTFMQTVLDFRKTSKATVLEDKVQYYRAQAILSRKVLKTFTQMQTQYGSPVFEERGYEKTIELYNTYLTQSSQKMDAIISSHPDEMSEFNAHLTKKSLKASGDKALSFMYSRGIVSEYDTEEIEMLYGHDSKA